MTSTCTNVYGRLRTMFWAMFDRTTMKMSLYRVVFRVEFDAAIRFCLDPPNLIFFIDLYRYVRCFSQFVHFPSFQKNLDFFMGPPSQRHCHRGHDLRRRGGGRCGIAIFCPSPVPFRHFVPPPIPCFLRGTAELLFESEIRNACL